MTVYTINSKQLMYQHITLLFKFLNISFVAFCVQFSNKNEWLCKYINVLPIISVRVFNPNISKNIFVQGRPIFDVLG